MASTEQNGSLYDRLSENVEKLQSLGKSWGMSDSEIDKCIQQALQSDRRKPATFMSRFLYSLRVCVLVLSFLLAFYVFLSFHRPTQQFISKQSQSWQYPILRFIRLMTLPITKKYKLDVFHELECLVDNPFYSDEPLDCWPCEMVTEIEDFTGFENFTEFYYHNGVPFYVTDADGVVVMYETLHDMYWDHEEEMDGAVDSFVCTNTSITAMKEFFSEWHTSDDLASSDVGAMWRTQRVSGVRLLRDLFPRPYFVPEKAEVTLEKFIFIDSPKAEPFQIPNLQAANGWLSQGSGQREIVLLPSDNCRKNCSDISVVLQPMDILFYHTHYWKPESFPHGDEVSIMFAGSFF
ncbi:bombesin receptor-activated protein C6orf89 homolog [Ptychodera flava]|uniref:bombesin receptor-activated protein C6orf89 homolog n=1 Tax=Ptychodera flava TaxID=63121 RepID=UPI003969CD0D